MILSTVAGSHYYGKGGDSASITDADTGFSVPQYDSQAEIVTQLVAPFIFVSFLLRLALSRALTLALAQDQHDRIAIFRPEERVDVSTESTVISIAITAMMIPTPAWDFVTILGQVLGVIPQLIILGFMLLLGYMILSR